MLTLKQIALVTLYLTALAFAPIGVANAQVKVTAATPSSTVQGTVSLDVIVSGSGFDSTSSAQFFVTGTTNSGGITVKKTVFRNSREIVATIDVADTADIASFDIQVTLSSGRKGKGTTLFLVKSKQVAVDPCVGATATTTYSKLSNTNANTGATHQLYLANDSSTCERLLYSFTTAYFHYASFRIVASAGGKEGRVVVSDGGEKLLLLRFPIGVDMAVDPASIIVQPIFDPLQAGSIDNMSYDLAADGHALTYVVMDQDAAGTWYFWLRYIDDVDDCVPISCAYEAGPVLAQRVGLYYRLVSPRWNSDGSLIYVEDYFGLGSSPSISRVSPHAVTLPTEPTVVLSGTALRLFEIRSRGADEVLLFGDKAAAGNGCRDIRVVTTASCGNGSCSDQVNSTATRMLVARWATLRSIDSNSMMILADGGKLDRKGSCVATNEIIRVVDSTITGVQVTTLTTGVGPASQ